MSGTQFQCSLGPSRGYTLACLLLHAGAVLALFMTRLHPFTVVPAMLALALACRAELRRNAWRTSREAVLALWLDAAGWWLARRDGRVVGPLELVSVRTFAAGVLLGLRGSDGATHVLPVPADAAHSASMRRLRAAARATAAGGGA